MFRGLVIFTVIAAVILLWATGLRLFLAAEMSVRRKAIWSLFLVVVGITVGFALSLPSLATKFLWLIAILPILAAVDVLVLRGKHRLAYWIRACGFEVVSVFGTAAICRSVLNHIGIAPMVDHASL